MKASRSEYPKERFIFLSFNRLRMVLLRQKQITIYLYSVAERREISKENK